MQSQHLAFCLMIGIQPWPQIGACASIEKLGSRPLALARDHDEHKGGKAESLLENNQFSP